MEMTLDFITGFIIFITALSITLYWGVTSIVLPFPSYYFVPRGEYYPVHLEIRDKGAYYEVTAKEGFSVRVTLVCFEGDRMEILRGITPLQLPKGYGFVVAFSGACVKYWGTPPKISGYITPYGIQTRMPDTGAYLIVKNGRVMDYYPKEVYQTSVLGFRRLVVERGVIMVGEE